MNQRGDSSVFNLLIAAVVAVAVIAVLFTILDQIKIVDPQQVVTQAKDSLKTAYQNIGTPSTSINVKIGKGVTITSLGVAGTDLGLPSSQVVLGRHRDLSDLLVQSGTSGMTFEGTSERTVRVVALCASAAASASGPALEEHIQSEYASWGIDEFFEPAGFDGSDPNKIACFVGIVPAA